MFTYALVLLYCTSKQECWKEIPYPAENFPTVEACQRALQHRAHALLQPHFARDELNIGLLCEGSPAKVAQPVASEGASPSGSSMPNGSSGAFGR